MTLLHKDWTFLAEGNANIVLKYIGLEEALTRSVLRISKVKDTKLDDNLQYQWALVNAIFGPKYYSGGSLITIDKQFLVSVQAQIQSMRHSSRKSKDIDVTATQGLLLPNLFTKDSAICFEIKPKWGFSPYKSSCRFCLHQKLRFIGSASRFCPLDLFSNNRDRVKMAMLDLFETPQNNLKVYSEGQFLSKPSTVFDTFLDAIVDAILLCDLFDVLRKAQMDFHDEIQELTDVGGDADEALISKLDTLLHQPPSNMIERVGRFLISQTLKDLSIIISLTESDTKGRNNVSVGENFYEYSFKLIDLDLKSSAKLAQYKDLDSLLQHACSPL